MNLTEREVQDFAVTIAALLAGRCDGQQAVATTAAQVEAIVARRVAAAVQDATDRVLAVLADAPGCSGPNNWCGAAGRPTCIWHRLRAALAHPTDPTPDTRKAETCGNCGADTFECSACGAGRGA